jgi:hypothetical protein
MLKSIEGFFRGGKIELLEPPPQGGDSRVLITFLPNQGLINLALRGMDQAQAANLRSRLESFAVDWDRSDMDIYDES